MRALSFAAVLFLAVFAAAAQEAPTAGRVEGAVRINGQVQPGQAVLLVEQGGSSGYPSQNKTTTGADGRYVFENVSPGRYMIGVMGEMKVRTSTGILPLTTLADARGIFVTAGEVSTVDIGGTGRKIVGRMAAPADSGIEVEWQGGSSRRLARDVQFPKPPEGMAPADQRAWVEKMTSSDEFKALWTQMSMFIINVNEDGSFFADDVPPGNYDLVIEVGEKNSAERAPAGMAVAKIIVPEGPADQPVDVGTVTVKLANRMRVGEQAPDFSVRGVDGKQVSLADYRGKYVLLDFWASWCGPCRMEMPNIKAVYDKFGQNPRFAIVGLNLDKTPEAAKDFVRSNGLNWTHGLLGDWKDTNVPESYGVNGIPAMFLIDPEGKIAATGLRGHAAMEAVEKALK